MVCRRDLVDSSGAVGRRGWTMGFVAEVVCHVVVGGIATAEPARLPPDRCMTGAPRRWRHGLRIRAYVNPAATVSPRRYTYDLRLERSPGGDRCHQSAEIHVQRHQPQLELCACWSSGLGLRPLDRDVPDPGPPTRSRWHLGSGQSVWVWLLSGELPLVRVVEPELVVLDVPFPVGVPVA